MSGFQIDNKTGLLKRRVSTMANEPKKKYQTIGEVARSFGVSIDLLRKWEAAFPKQIRPYRTKGETRLYDEKAINGVALVYRLLKEQRLTVEGAQRKLAKNPNGEEHTQEVIAKLQGLRDELMSIIGELDKL